MKIVLELFDRTTTPESRQYNDKYCNPKRTNFLVWDGDGQLRFAVHQNGSFRHSQNKKVIADVKYWAYLPENI